MRAAKVQASLRIRAVSPEPPLLAHTSSESRGIFRQKSRSLAPLNGRACAVEICHNGMLEDTNSLDGAHKLRNIIMIKWKLRKASVEGKLTVPWLVLVSLCQRYSLTWFHLASLCQCLVIFIQKVSCCVSDIFHLHISLWPLVIIGLFFFGSHHMF